MTEKTSLVEKVKDFLEISFPEVKEIENEDGSFKKEKPQDISIFLEDEENENGDAYLLNKDIYLCYASFLGGGLVTIKNRKINKLVFYSTVFLLLSLFGIILFVKKQVL